MDNDKIKKYLDKYMRPDGKITVTLWNPGDGEYEFTGTYQDVMIELGSSEAIFGTSGMIVDDDKNDSVQN